MEEKDEELLNPEDFEEETESKDDGKSNEEGKTENQDSKEESSNEDAKLKEQEAEDRKKKNAEYARKRREQEEAEREKREAKIRAEVERDTKLGIYKTNTYTNEPINDEEDLKVFEVMKELEKEGKDPINDYPKKVAEMNRKAREKAKLEEEKALKEKEDFSKDIADFKKKYPKVDLRELADNEEFIKFGADKTGRWTTAEIYEAFKKEQEMISLKNENKAKDKEANEQAKNINKTPSAKGSKPLSKSVDDMTNEEFMEYWKNKYH